MKGAGPQVEYAPLDGGGRIPGTPGRDVLAGQLWHRVRSGEDPVVMLASTLTAAGMPSADAEDVAYRHTRGHVGRADDAFRTDTDFRRFVRKQLAAWREQFSPPTDAADARKRDAAPGTGVRYNL